MQRAASRAMKTRDNRRFSRAMQAGKYPPPLLRRILRRRRMRNKSRARARMRARRRAASINYATMRGRVCYRRLEKSSALALESHSRIPIRTTLSLCLSLCLSLSLSLSLCLSISLSDRRGALPCRRRATGLIGRYTPVLRDRRCAGRVYCLNIRHNVSSSPARDFMPLVACSDGPLPRAGRRGRGIDRPNRRGWARLS